MEPYRIVFMGAPDFACPTLQALISSPHQVVGVFSQPPRKAGRGMSLTPTPVHALAEKNGIAVFTPEKFTPEALADLQNLKPDFIVVAAYGLLLPQAVLDVAIPLNIHPSELPRWRGAAPLQRTVMAGDTTTAMCIMHMVKALDAGDVYKRTPYSLKADETAGSLHDEMANLGADDLLAVLNSWADYKDNAAPQGEDGLTYASKLTTADRYIDFHQTPDQINAHVRGLNPWPAALTRLTLHGKDIDFKVHVADILDTQTNNPAGTVIKADTQNGLVVACTGGAVRLSRIQRPGKGGMADTDLLRGFNIPTGSLCHAPL